MRQNTDVCSVGGVQHNNFNRVKGSDLSRALSYERQFFTFLRLQEDSINFVALFHCLKFTRQFSMYR